VFAVQDIDEALSFYVEMLGFSIAWTWGEPVHRAGVAFNGIEIQLDSERAGTDGALVVYIHMDDVTSYFNSCRAKPPVG
jgi:catechol 2,3-dioxygenase-like lactoylglutathione lyase family enzyme